MNRRRGMIWIFAGLILALVAAGVTYFAFQQVVAQQQATPLEGPTTQTVVVAKQLINERAVVRLDDIGTEERPIEEVPSGAVFKTEDAIGRIANRSIPAGEVLLAQTLVESFAQGNVEAGEVVSGTINFNEALGETLVAYPLSATDKLSMEGILLPGDHIDLLFSTDVVGEQEGSGGKVSVYAIQDIEVLQVIYQPPPPPPEGEAAESAEEGETPVQQPDLVPKLLILAMDPQDAVTLKYAVDTQAPIDLALRATDNRRLFEVDAVTINILAERYQFEAPRPVP